MSGEPYWFVGLKQLTSEHNDVLSKKNKPICSPGASCSLPIGQWANVIDFPTSHVLIHWIPYSHLILQFLRRS